MVQPTPELKEEHLAHGEHAHDEHPHVNYMYIFYALCGLTFASYLADEIGGTKYVTHVLGGVRAKIIVGLLVLTIASFKASFVMLYFMHLKFEGRWKYVLLMPTMILAMAIVAALIPDIGVHYYDVQVPQTAQTFEVSHGQDAENASGTPHGSAPEGHK